jgi:hypothetical protein
MTPLLADAGPWVMLALLGAYHGINPGMGWLFAVALGLQEQNRKAVLRAFAPIALGHAVSIAAVVLLVAALQTVVSPSLLRMAGAGLLIGYGVYKIVAPMSHPRWVGMRVGFRDLAVWSFLMATAHGAGLMLVPILLKLPAGDKAAVPATAIAAPAPSVASANRTSAKADVHAGHESHSGHEGHEGHSGHEEHEGHAGHEMPATSAVPASPPTEHQDDGHGGHAATGGHADHSQHLQQAGISGPLAAMAAIALHTGAMFLVMALIAVAVYEKVGLAILRRAWFNLDLLWAVALIGAGIVTFFV